MRKTTAFMLALLAMAGTARASDEDKNGAPARTTVVIGAMTTLVGKDSVPASGATTADTAITPTAEVSVETPIRFRTGGDAAVRLYGRLGISSEPDSTVDLTSVKSFQAGTLGLGVKRYVGDVFFTGEWGFSSRISNSPEPLTRTARHWGFGLGVGQDDTANVTMIYGRDEAAGDFGWGQIMVWGGVPIAGTQGSLLLFGDATVNVGPRERTGTVLGQPAFSVNDQPITQRDVFRLGVSVDIPAAIAALKK